MNKTVKNATEALKDIKDGESIMFGGFGLCGIPENSKMRIFITLNFFRENLLILISATVMLNHCMDRKDMMMLS